MSLGSGDMAHVAIWSKIAGLATAGRVRGARCPNMKSVICGRRVPSKAAAPIKLLAELGARMTSERPILIVDHDIALRAELVSRLTLDGHFLPLALALSLKPRRRCMRATLGSLRSCLAAREPRTIPTAFVPCCVSKVMKCLLSLSPARIPRLMSYLASTLALRIT